MKEIYLRQKADSHHDVVKQYLCKQILNMAKSKKAV